MDYEQEIEALKRQFKSLRQQIQRHDEWLDTVNSPIYKRIFWWFCGYRFHRVGRWYAKNRPF